MPTDFLEMVRTLVEDELALYKSLEGLVDSEEEKVLASDMEGLLAVLQEKQAIIARQESMLDRWNQISAGLGIIEGREEPVFWNALSQRVGADGYSQIVRRIDEIKQLGQNLLDREGVIRQNLENNLAEMRKTLLRMGRNRVAMRGYSQGMASIY